MKPPIITPARISSGKKLLRQLPAFANLIDRVGPFRLRRQPDQEPYNALVRAIVYQAVSTKSAAAVYQRVRALVGDSTDPAILLATPAEVLRGSGLSWAKVNALHDLATKSKEGIVPTRAEAETLPDSDLIERLVQIRGVGRWTVEMLLIFGLGRADVLPVDDLAIRRGYQLAFARSQEPTRRALAKLGEDWSPYRSIASWYLWRATELDW